MIGLLVAFVSALVSGEVAQHLKLPAVVGQIAAGAAVGQHARGWLNLSQVVLSEFGAILLVFTVKLETKLLANMSHAPAKPATTPTEP